MEVLGSQIASLSAQCAPPPTPQTPVRCHELMALPCTGSTPVIKHMHVLAHRRLKGGWGVGEWGSLRSPQVVPGLLQGHTEQAVRLKSMSHHGPKKRGHVFPLRMTLL
jgi:hypothetical protein